MSVERVKINNALLAYCAARAKLTSQVKISEATGISVSAWQKKIQNRSDFTVSEVHKLIKVFKLSEQEILDIFFRG